MHTDGITLQRLDRALRDRLRPRLTGLLTEILGRPGLTYEQWARRHQDIFG